MQVTIMAGISANFAKGWYIGTHNETAAKQALRYRKAKSFHRRWDHQELAICVEPPQLSIAHPIYQLNTCFQRQLFYEGPDGGSLRTMVTDQQKRCMFVYLFLLKKFFKNLQRQWDILVCTVLRHHQNKWESF